MNTNTAQQSGPSYDRGLIAEILQDICYDDGYGMKANSTFTVEAIKEQIDALRAAENVDAAGVHTARQLQAAGGEGELAELISAVEQYLSTRKPSYERINNALKALKAAREN